MAIFYEIEYSLAQGLWITFIFEHPGLNACIVDVQCTFALVEILTGKV